MPYNDNMVSVENIIYRSFVKYNRLSKIVYDTFSNTSIASATKLNIFIDLYSVLKSIFSEHYRTDISDYTAITTGIINMCSHYRGFFRNLSVDTKFYLIFSFNTCDINRKFVAGYNEEFMRKSEIKIFNEVAMNNFELLDLLCPYLPNIFFIKSPRNFESSVVIANLIETLNDGNPNLIISKDIYPLQLCVMYPYTSFLYPFKINGEDLSTMIPINEKQSFRFEFWNLVSSIRKTDIRSIGSISPINFSLFSAMGRFPERSMKSLINVASIRNIILSLIGENDIKIIPKQLYENNELLSKIPVALIESRFKALDIDFMLPYYRNDPESKCIELKNLKDNSAINTINSRFFSHNPIDVNKL